jgi:hypothetical protein
MLLAQRPAISMNSSPIRHGPLALSCRRRLVDLCPAVRKKTNSRIFGALTLTSEPIFPHSGPHKSRFRGLSVVATWRKIPNRPPHRVAVLKVDRG